MVKKNTIKNEDGPRPISNGMEKIVSLCKRRGFIFQGSEIYGGLAGTWDYGHLGLALKKNIERSWWNMFVDARDDMYGVDSSILMNSAVWEASGHIAGFSDPLVACKKCKKRFRADHIEGARCPECGGDLGEAKQFNMMFQTHVGSVAGEDTIYLRPETAQGMFVNFKNIIDAHHPKLPFGIAQIGRAFRNEIAPRDFIFRVRELEIMELEYFVRGGEWEKYFEYWLESMREWFRVLGFGADDIKEVEIGGSDLAHYSKRTVDFHFRYPHKFDEIGGLAYRTDYDLKNHTEKSGVDLSYLDPLDNKKFVPHVLEPTFGLGRHVLAVLVKAYTEDELGGEKRIVLKFPKNLAPIRVAVFPLVKNKPELVDRARGIYENLKKSIPQTVWDDNGNIGKRYRRQDEIGTPYCVTVDYQTLEDNSVTIRDRDLGGQRRVAVDAIASSVS
ncbi:MAG TPA: glycine--tRNA ligase [Candidatus Paceibacterota bacterium]